MSESAGAEDVFDGAEKVVVSYVTMNSVSDTKRGSPCTPANFPNGRVGKARVFALGAMVQRDRETRTWSRALASRRTLDAQ